MKKYRHSTHIVKKKHIIALFTVITAFIIISQLNFTNIINYMLKNYYTMVLDNAYPIAFSDNSISSHITSYNVDTNVPSATDIINTQSNNSNNSIITADDNSDNNTTIDSSVDETNHTDSDTTNNTQSTNDERYSQVISNNIIKGAVYERSLLNTYSYALDNFYNIAGITELTSQMLKPAEFLDIDMSISHNSDTPQILILHTHSMEDFVDSIPGDVNTGIVGVGNYLTELLTNVYGYNVYHDTTCYDYVDGKLDRSKAYTYAENNIEKILNEHPSIEVVIDLHRDGVAETTHLVTEIDNKATAKIMFFNGLSHSKINGDISYLYNPYRDQNLAMSLQMQLLGNAYYPDFLRKIYINAYRYCLHLRGKSMLIEAGAQTNTLSEVKNAMEPLADMLDKLLRGEKVYQ